jgi:putative hydrolase of the HAD superfamily
VRRCDAGLIARADCSLYNTPVMDSESRPIKYILFDLDETIYPRGTGLMQDIGQRIREYIQVRLGLNSGQAQALRQEYYIKYGTSLRGLQINYNINAEEFLAYVHDLRLEKYIGPDQTLDRMLAGIPLSKVIFTNATEEHAWRVLTVLGVARHFERIIDVRSMGFKSKPHKEAYLRILDILEAQPGECLIIEDSLRNLRPAKEVGMVTVLVDGQADEAVDFAISNILQLGDILAKVETKP